jgi:uncharacterized protein YjbI with pentapeptide repeats
MSEIVESKEQFLIRIREREQRGCTFKKLRLSGVNVVGVDFTDVTFDSCDLDGMTLTGANLTRTVFTRVDLRKTLIDRGLLKRTMFTDCNLTELNLNHAQLEDVEFVRCDMDNVVFDSAYLGGCLFNVNRAYGLKLRNALLIRCRFSQERSAPELTRAQLAGAVVIESDFGGSCLLRADLKQALLIKSNLHHVLLRDAQFDSTSLVGCVTSGADLPGGLSST